MVPLFIVYYSETKRFLNVGHIAKLILEKGSLSSNLYVFDVLIDSKMKQNIHLTGKPGIKIYLFCVLVTSLANVMRCNRVIIGKKRVLILVGYHIMDICWTQTRGKICVKKCQFFKKLKNLISIFERTGSVMNDFV